LRQLFPNGVVNFMQLMFSQDGLRPYILNWTHTRLALLNRLRREATGNPASPSEALRRSFDSDAQTTGEEIMLHDESLDPMLSLELRVGRTRLRLFNTFTTFGTPQDVLLQEIRIDMSFPADETTRRFLDAASVVGIEGALGIRQDA
jgi:hypothetical protein